MINSSLIRVSSPIQRKLEFLNPKSSKKPPTCFILLPEAELKRTFLSVKYPSLSIKPRKNPFLKDYPILYRFLGTYSKDNPLKAVIEKERRKKKNRRWRV